MQDAAVVGLDRCRLGPDASEATTDAPGRDAAPTDAVHGHDGQDEQGDVSSDDDADDRYRLTSDPQVVRNISAIRRRGDVAFHQWVAKSQRHSTTKAAPSQPGQPNLADRASAARLIERNEEQRIIASPREYQIELFEKAKEKNLIIVLDTGSGKTLIAALLLRHVLDQEHERRARGEAKRVAFFLVDKVALCFQQYSVLKANLEYPVARFHGEIAGVMRTKEFWDKQFSESMVVVCTAQILLDCLNSGFLQMPQVNLLIFDEAHHTKKNHPYARIIKDHYMREKEKRPRILGMTASPVDSQTKDLHGAAAELEAILCSQIATVSDHALMRSQAHRHQVQLLEYYRRLPDPEDVRTPLWEEIAHIMRGDSHYRWHFEATQEAASTLGSWCADKYWELLMTDAEVGRRVARAHESAASALHTDGVVDADKAHEVMHSVQKAVRDVAAVSTLMAKAEPPVVSFKVKALQQVLDHYYGREQTSRCIVFVQKRFTAVLLAHAFDQIGFKVRGLRAAYLVGSQPLAGSITNMSFRDQVIALQRFRRGDTNCLFATQVAEEGIDIPECDLIIRFDLYDSAIQYIQSKGRARQANSTYITMMEKDNMQHLRKVKQAMRDAHSLRRFCSALPADRKIRDIFDAEELAEHECIAQKVYEIEETGARLTFASSQEVLAKFVSSLTVNEASLAPEYIITPSHATKKFVATVVFPDTSPIKVKRGFAQRNKRLARCSAAFEACVDLVKKGFVNEHLQPTLGKRLPAMRNARLALSSNKREEYVMRVKPAIWSQPHPVMPTHLYRSILILDKPEAVQRPTSPMMLLTRRALPSVDPMLLYFGLGRTSVARIVPSIKPLELTPDEAELLASFTLTIFSDVFSKDYNAGAADMPYFLAPCAQSRPRDGISTADPTRIDWDIVKGVVHSERPEWRGAPEEFFCNKLAIDPWDGSRKFILHGINSSLKPSDPVPEGVPMPRSRSYRQVQQIIKEYSNSLTINPRRRMKWDENQPVVNATLLPLRRNFLDEYSAEDDCDQRCYVILEPLRLSNLPVDLVSMALIVPIMMYRLDSVLITLEACQLLGLRIQPSLALEALTKDSSNSDEHGEEQLDFQVGMGNNYERLEFLGDAFLKMATSISLFTLIPNTTEFEYHVERMLLVCNQNLFNHAVDSKLQEFIRSKSFDRRTWYPDLNLSRGKSAKAGGALHKLSDKSIADVCEALIGAAYLTHDDTGNMDLAVKAVTKMVKSKNHKMQRFSDYFQSFKMPDWQKAPASATQRAAVDRVYTVTGYRFQWPNLLRSAFKHPSYPYETMPNYQRLEFLGDALLDLVIVEHLYRRFPDADPQWLTEHKMAMVSNHFFGSLCVHMGLQRHLLMTSSALINQISDYVTELEQAEVEAALLQKEKNQQKSRKDYWLNTSQPPKVLSDMVEALVGAMFVDSQYDYCVVQRFFDAHIKPYFEDMALYDTYASHHPVTALAHLLQNQLGCQNWRLYVSSVPVSADKGVASFVEDEAVCALMVHEKAVEHTTAKTGRDAKLAVSKMALKRLEGMDRDAFREETGCTCHLRDGAGKTEAKGGGGLEALTEAEAGGGGLEALTGA